MCERLRTGGLGSSEVAVHGGDEGAAAGTRCLRPRTSEQVPPGLQLPRQRPCGPKLSEGSQGLDFVGQELYDARFPESDGSGRISETAQVGVRVVVVVEGQCDEAENGHHL